MKDDDSSSSSSGGRVSAISYLFLSIIGLVLVVTPIQVYLNEPKDRPIVACYNASKLHSFFWILPLKIFTPQDSVTILDHSLDVQDTYRRCVNTLRDWDWLTGR